MLQLFITTHFLFIYELLQINDAIASLGKLGRLDIHWLNHLIYL